MKVIFAALLFTSFTANASPLMSTKELLRLHLWVNGVTDKPTEDKKLTRPKKPLPEELERSLQKI